MTKEMLKCCITLKSNMDRFIAFTANVPTEVAAPLKSNMDRFIV